MLFENNPMILESQVLLRKSAWKFVGGIREANESFQEAIVKRVFSITGLKLNGIEHLSTITTDKERKYLYHAKLTDKDVNNIERANGFLLQFFTIKEIDLLTLSTTTQIFVDRHREFIENVNMSVAPHPASIL